MSTVDFGLTSDDYAKHRADFPDSIFERVRPFGIGLPDQRIVDLGTGTGALGRIFAKRGAHITGVDISAEMLAKAQMLADQSGLRYHCHQASAEETRLPEHAFDVVMAGQCWHWFDRQRAAREALRLLVSKGTLFLAHFDWVPAIGNVVETTEALIEKFNPAQPKPHIRFAGATGIYGHWTFELTAAGFQSIETFSYDIDVPYTHVGWRGRIRASQGVGAMLSPIDVAAFDEAHKATLAERFPEPILQIPHRVFALICRAP
jgi:SAM-dependent methyltransferase